MESGRRLGASPTTGAGCPDRNTGPSGGRISARPGPRPSGTGSPGDPRRGSGKDQPAATRHRGPTRRPVRVKGSSCDENSVAPAGRVELPTSRSVAERSVQLSYAGAEILVPTCQGRCLAASGCLRRSAPNRNFRGPDPVPNVPGHSGTLAAIRFSSPDRGRRSPLAGSVLVVPGRIELPTSELSALRSTTELRDEETGRAVAGPGPGGRAACRRQWGRARNG